MKKLQKEFREAKAKKASKHWQQRDGDFSGHLTLASTSTEGCRSAETRLVVKKKPLVSACLQQSWNVFPGCRKQEDDRESRYRTPPAFLAFEHAQDMFRRRRRHRHHVAFSSTSPRRLAVPGESVPMSPPLRRYRHRWWMRGLKRAHPTFIAPGVTCIFQVQSTLKSNLFQV